MVGGAAYAGKKAGERKATRESGQAGDEPAGGSPPASNMDEKIEQLKKLGELRDSGVLTDAEFETQKQQILGA